MKFNLAVFGCQMNDNDADRIRTILKKIGGIEELDQAKADIIIFVTCSIRRHAEDKIFGMVHNLKKKYPKKIIALTGCMVRITSSRFYEKKDSLLHRTKLIDFVFHIKDVSKLPELLTDYFSVPNEFKGEFLGIFETKPTQLKSFSGFVPISSGCDHHCTYCIVPYTRGKEVCRSKEEILDECKYLIEKGAKEITLLGQNVNRYYFGKREVNPYKTDFAKLLDEVAQLPIEWLRFLSPHPQHMGNDVIEVMKKNKNICNHLHLPVQAGDDEVLRKMARGYTVEKFKNTIKKTREAIPNICITTDIIVGFCGETEEQFNNTKILCEEEEFDKIFIAKFSVRPNTPASKWDDDVSHEEKKRRFHIINEILKKTSLKRNKVFLDKEVKVLVSKIKDDIIEGHTSESKTVFLKLQENIKEGDFISAKITEVDNFYLKGKVI